MAADTIQCGRMGVDNIGTLRARYFDETLGEHANNRPLSDDGQISHNALGLLAAIKLQSVNLLDGGNRLALIMF